MTACGGRRRKAALRRSALPFPSAAYGKLPEPRLPANCGHSALRSMAVTDRCLSNNCGRRARPASTPARAYHLRNAGKHPHGDAQPLPRPVGPPSSTRDTLPQHAPRGVGLAIRGQSEGFESPARRLRRTKPKRAKADAIPAEARRTGNTTGNRGWLSCSTDGSRMSHEQ